MEKGVDININIETYDAISSKIRKIQEKPAICIEAGHIYTDESPSTIHKMGALVGAKLATAFEYLGAPVQKMLFIDDYNSNSNFLDLNAYQALLTKYGFKPDLIVMESSLTDDADSVITRLENNSLTELNKHGALILKKQSKRDKEIVIRKSPAMQSNPSCTALDTALYLQKNSTAGICATVLPIDYKEQQEKVRKTLRALDEDIPILEVFYTEEGNIEIEFDY